MVTRNYGMGTEFPNLPIYPLVLCFPALFPRGQYSIGGWERGTKMLQMLSQISANLRRGYINKHLVVR